MKQRRCKLCGHGMGSEDGGVHASCLAAFHERRASAAPLTKRERVVRCCSLACARTTTSKNLPQLSA